MKKILSRLLACAVPLLPAVASAAAPAATFTDFSYVGTPMSGSPEQAENGMYLNPIMAGSVSDPSIVRVGRN